MSVGTSRAGLRPEVQLGVRLLAQLSGWQRYSAASLEALAAAVANSPGRASSDAPESGLMRLSSRLTLPAVIRGSDLGHRPALADPSK